MKFTCSRCKAGKARNGFHEAKSRKHPVSSWCKLCRSEAYFAKRYPGSVCAQCQRHRALDKNQVCRPCNEESGLRQCRGTCQEILPLFLKFYGKKAICKDCLAKLRGLRGKARSR